MADAHGGAVELVGVVFDLGHEVKVAQSLAEGVGTEGAIDFQEELAAQGVVATVVVDGAGGAGELGRTRFAMAG